MHELRSVLTINSVTEDDMGSYSCEARNPAGMYKKVTVDMQLGMTKLIGAVHKLCNAEGGGVWPSVTIVFFSSEFRSQVLHGGVKNCHDITYGWPHSARS